MSRPSKPETWIDIAKLAVAAGELDNIYEEISTWGVRQSKEADKLHADIQTLKGRGYYKGYIRDVLPGDIYLTMALAPLDYPDPFARPAEYKLYSADVENSHTPKIVCVYHSHNKKKLEDAVKQFHIDVDRLINSKHENIPQVYGICRSPAFPAIIFHGTTRDSIYNYRAAIPCSPRELLIPSSSESMPSVSWANLTGDLDDVTLRDAIRNIVCQLPHPWREIDEVPPVVELPVMNVLQWELDHTDSDDRYYTLCMKCLRALGWARSIFPDCFISLSIVKTGNFPVTGGGLADIWLGKMNGQAVCLKVLRIFTTKLRQADLLKAICKEALVWRQLRHENILPFLGINSSYFEPSYCLISPWMRNGNIIRYLEDHPNHNRFKCVQEIANAVAFLHGLDPQIVHGDIHGGNILVADDLRCCLADFGASIIVATQAPSSNTMNQNTFRWLAPELYDYDSTSHNQAFLTGRDIYAFGCTVIELFTLQPPYPHLLPIAMVNHINSGKGHPRPPADVFPSDDLWELVKKCMEHDPKRRFSAAKIKLRLADIITS